MTRKLAKACANLCVQLATMLQAGLRNTASITGIGPGRRDHETQFPGGRVLPVGLNGFWSGCPKAPDRERREVRKRHSHCHYFDTQGTDGLASGSVDPAI